MKRKEHVHKGWNSEASAEDELSNIMALTTFMNHKERSEKSCSDYVAGTDRACSSSSSESESDQDVDFLAKFKMMYEDWLKSRKENLSLVEDRSSLQEKVVKLEEELKAEKEKVKLLESEHMVNKKNTSMLNSGTNTNLGLGYCRGSSNSKIIVQENISTSAGTKVKLLEQKGTTNKKNIMNIKNTGGTKIQQINKKKSKSAATKIQNDDWNKEKSVPTNFQRKYEGVTCTSGCYFCGKVGHIKAYCYKFLAKVRCALRQNKFVPDQRRLHKVWIKKVDLYGDMACKISTSSSENSMHDTCRCSNNMSSGQERFQKKIGNGFCGNHWRSKVSRRS